jgi:glutamine amidotransferase
MIAIVDYDAGNLHSVGKAVETVGLRARTTARPADLESADAVILPGVGAFAPCMARLAERGFVAPLCAYLAADRPFLGICLGLQMLFE